MLGNQDLSAQRLSEALSIFAGGMRDADPTIGDVAAVTVQPGRSPNGFSLRTFDIAVAADLRGEARHTRIATSFDWMQQLAPMTGDWRVSAAFLAFPDLSPSTVILIANPDILGAIARDAIAQGLAAGQVQSAKGMRPWMGFAHRRANAVIALRSEPDGTVSASALRDLKEVKVGEASVRTIHPASGWEPVPGFELEFDDRGGIDRWKSIRRFVQHANAGLRDPFVFQGMVKPLQARDEARLDTIIDEALRRFSPDCPEIAVAVPNPAQGWPDPATGYARIFDQLDSYLGYRIDTNLIRCVSAALAEFQPVSFEFTLSDGTMPLRWSQVAEAPGCYARTEPDGLSAHEAMERSVAFVAWLEEAPMPEADRKAVLEAIGM